MKKRLNVSNSLLPKDNKDHRTVKTNISHSPAFAGQEGIYNYLYLLDSRLVLS